MWQAVTGQARFLVRFAQQAGMADLADQWTTFVTRRSTAWTYFDLTSMATARNRDGVRLRAEGRADEARAAHEVARWAFRQAGASVGLAFSESCLGFLAADVGEVVTARAHHLRRARRGGRRRCAAFHRARWKAWLPSAATTPRPLSCWERPTRSGRPIARDRRPTVTTWRPCDGGARSGSARPPSSTRGVPVARPTGPPPRAGSASRNVLIRATGARSENRAPVCAGVA